MRLSTFLAAAAGTCLLAAAAGPAFAGGSYTVSGVVTLSDSPADLSGTHVKLTGTRTLGGIANFVFDDSTTGAGGNYSRQGFFDSENVVVTASRAGYLTASTAAFAVTGDVTAPPLVLQRAQTITGQVLADDGLPAPAGLTVTLLVAGGANRTVTTTEGGRFAFDGLAPGTYTLSVSRPCAPTVTQQVTVPSAFVTVELPGNKFVVRGTVTLANRTGGEQSGTTVSISQAASATVSVTTDPLGAYAFNELCGGTYQLAASRIGYLPGSTTVSATASVTTVPPLVLQPATFSVGGNVFVIGGGDATGVLVTLAGTTLTATSGVGGAFRIDGVPAGVYTLRAVKSGLTEVVIPRLEVGASVAALTLYLATPPPVVKQKVGCAQAGETSDAAGFGLALLVVAAAFATRRRPRLLLQPSPGHDDAAGDAVNAARPALALAGRVPVKVTDEGGPIRMGDLLTTSSTPGHALRCADRQLCLGAVVGKALQPHARGLIVALVTLQ